MSVDGLVGKPGALKWARIRLNGCDWPVIEGKYFAYTFKAVVHPYGEDVYLTLCAEKDPHNHMGAKYVPYKTFVRDYLKSGKCLYIYPTSPHVDLCRELICLDFISDVLGERLIQEIESVKKELDVRASEKLPTGDNDNAADDEDVVDYY